MRVPRVYIDAELSPNSTLLLPEEVQRHLCQVLRLQPGAPLTAFNGRGGEFAAELGSVTKKSAILDVREFRATERESSLPVHLAQGISRGERMTYAIQKAVELGVASIQPLFSEHCEVRLNEERADKRQRHWQNVVISACEQCGRNRVPVVHEAARLGDWLGRLAHHPGAGEHRLVLHPDAAQRLASLPPATAGVTLLIGPEGGLSEAEVALSAQWGFVPVRFGPRILRTETAAAAALAAVQALWGDLR